MGRFLWQSTLLVGFAGVAVLLIRHSDEILPLRDHVIAKIEKMIEEPVSVQVVHDLTISCGFQGRHMNVSVCFENTELRLERSGRTEIYKVYDLDRIGGREDHEGYQFTVTGPFFIRMQNSSDTLILTLTVRDRDGDFVYSDSASRYGTIFYKSR